MSRHELLLHALVVCVRLMSREQAMRLLLGIRDDANVRRVLKPLRAAGLIEEITVMAKPVPVMKVPLFSSGGGKALAIRTGEDSIAGATLFVEDILRLARSRWAGLSAVPIRCVVATDRARNLFGVCRSREFGKTLQSTHDLAVSAVFITYFEQVGEVEHWVSEDFSDACKLDGCALDAVILDADGQRQKGVEVIGGDYEEPRIRRTCENCDKQGLPYELW